MKTFKANPHWQNAGRAQRVLDCGGKAGAATPLSPAPRLTNLRPLSPARKLRRRCVLLEQSKTWRNFVVVAHAQSYSIDWFTIDGGVALSAIQGLVAVVKEKKVQISALEAWVGQLERLVKQLAEKSTR